MGRLGRWVVAGLVTVASFTAVTWIGGALVLPPMLKDGAVRWGLASALGVALAALAAVWGHGFATGTGSESSPAPAAAVSVDVAGAGAVGVGRDNRAPLTTAGGRAGTDAPAAPAVSPQAAPKEPTAPGATTVSAAGEGAIAVGRDNFGPLSTDGRPTGQQP
jgi:hypothetical protein